MANRNGSITQVDVRSHENNLAHRTREIDRERLIVRRGQPFSIALQCADPLTPDHQLELVLHLGKREEVEINVTKDHRARDKWWFHQQVAQDEILLTLHSPADAIVGQYHLTVLVTSTHDSDTHKTDGIGFHLLFNPWCKDDAVYLPDEGKLQEYIMNEDGLIYMGDADNIINIPWNFGQFEDNVMDICFEILNNSKEALKNPKMDIEKRSDPVHVCRMITAMVNSNGDMGVLTGRWQTPYFGGVAPNRWTGSVPILRQWSTAGFRAVRYGQCWVFAAVACTVLRCLGIPTRHITNFASAHDVDGNLSIDILLNRNLESVGKEDSSWNFHCWVESWMRRDDLPTGNNGWQVSDPTPQELSGGEFCCGPCPVNAIKEGNLNMNYDAAFIFAEVNADIIHWKVEPDGQRRKIAVDHSSVGRNISTKSVYGDFREDLTLHYKYPDGSKKEREVYMKAGRRVAEPTNGVDKPVQLKLSIKHGKPVFGTDFDVVVEVMNEGRTDASAHLMILAMAVTYTSVNQGECQRKASRVTLQPQTTHKEVLRLRYDDYAKCVSDHNVIRVKAFAEATGENEPAMAMANIPLTMPEVLVQVSGKTTVHEKASVRISFTNPLSVPLRHGVFTVEGSGLLTATQIHVNGEVAPGQKVSVMLSFIPVRSGVRKLLVDFDSDRLKDVKGVATLVVRKGYLISGFRTNI